MKVLKRFSYTLTFLAVFFAWMWLRPDPPAQTYQMVGTTMGTTYRIQLWEFPESVDDQGLADGIQQRLYRVDREQMSTYADGSELSLFNDSPVGQWFPVSRDLAYVVQSALAVSELTDGHFDVTVGTLVERWGFGGREFAEVDQRVPDTGELEALGQYVGYHHLEARLDPPALRKHAPVRVELGGIAKGYGADVVAEYFDSLGMENYFIEVGGELRIRGYRADGSAWVPAIERPVAGTSQVQEVLTTHGRSLALAGSGDYRNFFEHDGARLSHEISPFTGRPVDHGLAAAYVISDTAMVADALSTAFMVMGLERSVQLAETEGIAAYFIYRDEGDGSFSYIHTAAFAEYLVR